eukprot:m.31867 g.31867  ORF g.31867 m.31867 type:complete len:81 (+) comp8355_c0_seq1:8523-8765(+)
MLPHNCQASSARKLVLWSCHEFFPELRTPASLCLMVVRSSKLTSSTQYDLSKTRNISKQSIHTQACLVYTHNLVTKNYNK